MLAVSASGVAPALPTWIRETAYAGNRKGLESQYALLRRSGAYSSHVTEVVQRGPAIIPDMPFTPENAKAMRARSHGLRRAAFWRAQGFPNLVLVREARARNCGRRWELIAAVYTREEAEAIVKSGHNVACAKAAKTPEGRHLQAYLNSS